MAPEGPARRSRILRTLAGLLLFSALGLVLFSGRRTGEPARPAAPRAAPAADRSTSGAGSGGAERPVGEGRAAAREVAGAEDMREETGAPVPEPSAEATLDELDALLAQLRKLEQQLEGSAYFEHGARMVERACELVPALRPEGGERIERALRDPLANARWRGTLLCLLGSEADDARRGRLLAALGSEPEAVARCGAVWGLASFGSGASARPYGVFAFYRDTRYQELPWFPVVLASTALPEAVVSALLARAEDPLEDLLVREAAALVVGQTVDGERGVLEACMRHLGASPWREDPLVPAWLFVAVHASRDDVLERLAGLVRSLMTRPKEVGQGLELLAALLRGQPSPELCALALEALRTGLGGALDRNRVVLCLALAVRGGVALDEDTARAMAALLHDTASGDGLHTTRVSALLALQQVDPRQAQALIETALVSDLDPSMRSRAAALSTEAFEPERALELLASALEREVDPEVRMRIVKAIGRVPGEEAQALLERLEPRLEAELAEAVRAALERRRGG